MHIVYSQSTCETVLQSAHTYISGDVFRSISTHVLTKKSIDDVDVSHVKFNDILFLNTDHLEHFFANYYPKITVPFRLITFDSDEIVPGIFAPYLADEKLLIWYGQNVDSTHHKMMSLPIGIPNHSVAPNNVDFITQLIRNKPEKKHLLYCNFSIETNPAARQPVADYFSNKPFCYQPGKTSLPNYLHDVAQSKFVISPEGNGPDCYRTWEALLLDAIPIVNSTCVDNLFKDLPVIIVTDWSVITKDFLQEHYKDITQKKRRGLYRLEKIYADYWLKQIKKSP